MNIVPLNLFKLLKPKRSRMAAMLDRKNEQQEEKDAQQVVNASGYTLVDMAIPGGRRLDMMTSGHSLAKHIDKSRSAQGNAKARWQPMKNEQHYNPNIIKPDAQLEFNVKRQGLIEVPREVVLEQLDEISEEDWIIGEPIEASTQSSIFEDNSLAELAVAKEAVAESAEQTDTEERAADPAPESAVELPVEEEAASPEQPASESPIETPLAGLIVEDQVFQSL